MTNTDRLDADPVEPIRLAALDIVKAKSLAVVLFDQSVAYTDFRYEAAQQINALVLTVSNLEFEIETCKKWLEQSDAKSEQLRKERDELRQQIETIKNGFEGGCYLCDLVAEARDEARREVRALQKKIGDTSTMLYDWDGYYNPHSQSGNIVEMAKLVEEAYSTLQGRSWNEEKSK